MGKTYRIVMIGRPNDGKSSVFANLLGDDNIAVSPMPGETKRIEPRRLNIGENDVEIIDTPGLQHPEAVYKSFRSSAMQGLFPPAEFLQNFTDLKYRHDCEIMKALLDADICVIVSNADNIFGRTSQLLLDSLSYIRQKCVLFGLINKTDESNTAQWKNEFAERRIECFCFDAFKSNLGDCIKLLDEMKNSNTVMGDADLKKAFGGLQSNRMQLLDSYLNGAALEILNSLKEFVLIKNTAPIEGFSSKKEERNALLAKESEKVAEFEKAFRKRLLELFKYTGLKIDMPLRRFAEGEIVVKEASIFKRVFALLPLTKRPEITAKINANSQLPIKFTRNAIFFIENLLNLSYAKSATKEFKISIDKSEYKSIPVDTDGIAAFAYRASNNDDSEHFFKIQSALKDSILKILKNVVNFKK